VGLVEAFLKDGRFADRAMPLGLTRELATGTLRWLGQLQHIEQTYCRRPAERWTRSVLLTGFYEILYTRGADHAAVSERVTLVKERRKKAVANMVNAVLRRCVRERETWQKTFKEAPLELRSSHPHALVQGWRSWMSEAQVEAVCLWNQRQPATWARVRDPALFEEWRKAGVTFEQLFEPSRISDLTSHSPADDLDLKSGNLADDSDLKCEIRNVKFALEKFAILQRPGPISKLPGFLEGHFYIQDPSTSIAPHLLDAQPGERVLDACAAPGGKAIIIAEAMQGQGTLVAADRHEDRLPRLRENLERMQATWVEVRCEDAAKPKPASADERFDAILLDVPCSNSGVLARRPEARWRIDPKRLRKLHQTQLELLQVSFQRLAPGGRMVYSTCSIEPIETIEVIAAFLASEPAAKEGDSQLNLPGQDRADGAFACVVLRPE